MSYLISHSEVDTFKQDQLRHYYAHVLKIAPIEDNKSLQRGTCGHLFLETFLSEKKNGASTAAASKRAAEAAAEFNLESFSEVAEQLELWVEYIWPDLNWEIVEVEKEFRVPVGKTEQGEDIIFPCKVDAIVKIGANFVIVDHKFIYNFYTQDVADICSQLPKYMGAARYNGYDVKYSKYNLIRTRQVKDFDKRFKQLRVDPSNEKLTKMFEDQIKLMKIIADRQEKGIAHKEAVPACNSYVSKEDPYLPLMLLDLDGRNTTSMIKANYKSNEYGYEE